MVWLANPFAVELSVWMGDQCCGHLISLSVCRSGTITLAVTKSLANYASEAEDMTRLIIWARDSIGPLSRGIGSFSKQKMCYPVRLCVQVSLMYTVSECADKIMLLDI